MAKRPAKKVVKRPVRSAAKTSGKPTAKAKAPRLKSKPVKVVAKLAKTIKPAKPAPPAPRQVVPPSAPVSTIKSPSVEAVTAFERSMGALQRHDYKAASAAFQALLAQFPAEGFLTDRARVYLELATRELRRKPAGTGSVEERLTSATLALNDHNDDEAAKLAADVLKDDRSQDLAAYLLAVVASRRGDVNTALSHLRNAISINPECRLQARQDEEFDPLMDSDEFHLLIEAPATASAAAALGRKPVRKTGR